MKFLVFKVSENRYALPAREVVEVTPMVLLHGLKSKAGYLLGIMNYRSEKIPVIDLCNLIMKTEHQKMMTTRIIIVEYHSDHYSGLLGMIAEQVTELTDIDEKEFDSGASIHNLPYLGGVASRDHTLIQRLVPAGILLKSDSDLLPAQEGYA